MRTAALLSIALGLAACEEPPERAHLARLANEAEPLIRKLVGPGRVILTIAGASAEWIVSECLSVDAEMRQLAAIDFDGDGVWIPIETSLAWQASVFLHEKDARCRAEDPLERCSRWCVVRWTALANAVERFRMRADDYSVFIDSLYKFTGEELEFYNRFQ